MRNRAFANPVFVSSDPETNEPDSSLCGSVFGTGASERPACSRQQRL